MSEKYDVLVIGSGPNGLAAAITCAKKGLSTLLMEARSRIGGGLHTEEMELSGFFYDTCSAIHPLGVASQFFTELNLSDLGLEWVYSPVEVAHPIDQKNAVLFTRDIVETAKQFSSDANRYVELIQPFVKRWDELREIVLKPPSIPGSPFLAAQFGLQGIRSAEHLAKSYFHDPVLASGLAGLAAHSVLPFDAMGTAAFALLFATTAHGAGWPFPRGGAESLAQALGKYFLKLGGKIETNRKVNTIEELPDHRVALFDLTPKEFLRVAGDRLPSSYRERLEKYEYGSGVFKVDFALSEAVPFLSEGCRHAATVHIGGTFDEIARSEKEVSEGTHPEKPFVLLAQHTPFDHSRAPAGKHTAWAYCHVPNGSKKDMSREIVQQIERFAPGFRDTILHQQSMNCEAFERLNPNYVGGDINGGSLKFSQIVGRPVWSLNPYKTPIDGVYLCSAATPPGSGVHGMCGKNAAERAIKAYFD